jgi:hypothetical protein
LGQKWSDSLPLFTATFDHTVFAARIGGLLKGPKMSVPRY